MPAALRLPLSPRFGFQSPVYRAVNLPICFKLVDITKPICLEIDAKKADYLIFYTTGVEPYVAENNPKFLNAMN